MKRRFCRLELESETLARRIVDIASDKQATDVVLLSLRDASPIADYFVICSGSSDRQVKALMDQITETLAEEEKVKPLHREGKPDSGWVLLDYGGVIVHVFSQEAREFYRLEKVWAESVPVLRIA
jgi:ribosome-associated protein